MEQIYFMFYSTYKLINVGKTSWTRGSNRNIMYNIVLKEFKIVVHCAKRFHRMKELFMLLKSICMHSFSMIFLFIIIKRYRLTFKYSDDRIPLIDEDWKLTTR